MENSLGNTLALDYHSAIYYYRSEGKPGKKFKLISRGLLTAQVSIWTPTRGANHRSYPQLPHSKLHTCPRSNSERRGKRQLALRQSKGRPGFDEWDYLAE